MYGRMLPISRVPDLYPTPVAWPKVLIYYTFGHAVKPADSTEGFWRALHEYVNFDR